MKLAIISDVHLGDPNCTLIKTDKSRGTKFNEFKRIIGSNDYLILLGDIFDFSISPYEKVYEIAQVFLNNVQRLGVAKQIIYVPGNHDFEFWHILEHEVNIINRIKAQNQKNPRQFRWSVPGVFDDRKEREEDKFTLPDVTPKPGNSSEKYGDVFLSYMAIPPLAFNVAYPNLYIITNDGECVLLTHGQYFEPYWALTGEWAPKIAKNDLRLTDPTRGHLTLKELVAFNFPLSQLASSGIGQAGRLTDVVRLVQRKVKDKDLRLIRKYLQRFDDEVLDKELDYLEFDPREWATDALIGIVKRFITSQLGKLRTARFDEHFTEREEVRQRFTNFFRASLREINRLKTLPGDRAVDVPKPPNRVIFGHTHQAISWDDTDLSHDVDDITVHLHNTGGWLTRKGKGGKEEFCGASIFFYETDRGFYSKEIT